MTPEQWTEYRARVEAGFETYQPRIDALLDDITKAGEGDARAAAVAAMAYLAGEAAARLDALVIGGDDLDEQLAGFMLDDSRASLRAVMAYGADPAIDPDNPPMTEEQLAGMRRARDVLPEAVRAAFSPKPRSGC